MASLRKVGKSWIACITLADGTRTERSTGIKDVGAPQERAKQERLAREIAAQFEEAGRGNKTEAQIRKNMGELFFRVSSKRIEFAQTENFLRSWLARVKVRKSDGTSTRYGQVMDDFLTHLGAKAIKPLAEVDVEDIQSYLDAQLTSGKKAKTVRNEAKILNPPFAFAQRQGLILTNPVAAADLPDDQSESKTPFAPTQVSAIVEAATGEWKTVALLGAYTGARLTDCANLTWGNVDLAAKLLRYRPQKTARHKKDIVCPLHPKLHAHLLTLAGPDDPAAKLTPSLAGRYTGGRTGLSQQFEKIMRTAGIANEPIATGNGKGRAFKPFGFHSYRHTFKSILVNAGVEVQTVDVLTGHAKKTVSETYIHRGLDLLRLAVEKLPAF